MATTQNHMNEEQQSYGGQSFEPFEFDETVDPDLPDGVTFTLVVNDVKIRASNADANGRSYPQMVLEWKATGTDDESEEAQRAIGNTTSEFITLRPKGDRKGNLSKQRLTTLRGKFGIDAEVVPTQMTSLDDLQPLADALKGNETTSKVKSAKDKTGQWRTTVLIEAAGGGETVEAEEGEEEAPPAKPAAKAASTKKPAAGKPAAAKKAARR